MANVTCSVTVTATDTDGQHAEATVFYQVPAEQPGPPQTASGRVTWHGTALGVHPFRGNAGQSVGALIRTGITTGNHGNTGVPGTARGAVGWKGVATGARPGATGKQGSATGRFTKAGSAIGVRPGPPPPPGDRPYIAYTVDSFFRSKAAGAPIDEARTAQFINFQKTFVDDKGNHASQYAYPRLQGVAGNLWGTAFALGKASDPIWKVTGKSSGTAAATQQLTVTGFHAPENLGTLVTGTSDSPLCVIDTAFGITVFVTNSTWNAGMGHNIAVGGATGGSASCFWHSSNGLNSANPRSNDSRNWSSRGRISDALVIRRDEVDYAIAKGTDCGHIIHCFIMESKSGFCHPMTGDEGARGGYGVEGERVIIRPGINLTTRGLSPAGLAIARTLQNYGMMIGDNAGSFTCLHCEVEYPSHPVWNGLLNQDSLRGLTWDDFACVQLGWQ